MSFFSALFLGDCSDYDWYKAEHGEQSSSGSSANTSSRDEESSGGGLFSFLFGSGSSDNGSGSSTSRGQVSDNDDYPHYQEVHGIRVNASSRRDLQQGIQTINDLASNPKWRAALESERTAKNWFFEPRPTGNGGHEVLGHSGGAGVSVSTSLGRGYRAKVAAHELAHTAFGANEEEADDFAGL